MSAQEPRRRDRFAKLFPSRKKGKGEDAGSTVEKLASSELKSNTKSNNISAVLSPKPASKLMDTQDSPSSGSVDASHAQDPG